MTAARHILRYLKHTLDLELRLVKKASPELKGYSDSDFGGDVDNSRSTSGYVFLINGGAVSWKSQQQSLVAESTLEAEYTAMSSASSECIWLQGLLDEIMDNFNGSMASSNGSNDNKKICISERFSTILADNQGAIAVAHNPGMNKRSKHIRIRYHRVRDLVENEEVKFEYCPTSEMVADCLTKSLPRPTHEQHRKALGLVA